MSVDERDLRITLVAFEDAATWCEILADLTDKHIEAARAGKPLSAAELQGAARQVADTRRYLESNRREMDRIKKRAGIN
jgi:hypothetical protein